MPCVQPYPDSLLDEVAADQPGPEAAAVSRETISLAFLAAIQLLPPRQWAVLILRHVDSSPAAEVAEIPDMSVPAVTSALHRARTKLGDQWPDGRLDWAQAAEPDRGQRPVLQQFIAARGQACATPGQDVLSRPGRQRSRDHGGPGVEARPGGGRDHLSGLAVDPDVAVDLAGIALAHDRDCLARRVDRYRVVVAVRQSEACRCLVQCPRCSV
jgi:hypothetical protein